MRTSDPEYQAYRDDCKQRADEEAEQDFADWVAIQEREAADEEVAQKTGGEFLSEAAYLAAKRDTLDRLADDLRALTDDLSDEQLHDLYASTCDVIAASMLQVIMEDRGIDA